MRYSSEHKDAVRSRIVEAASRALRKSGLDGVSIPALMKKAGLTHGGFYAHFSDRDELVAEAVGFAANETGTRVFEGSADVGGMLGGYLSAVHVEHPELGCVVAALGAEAPRQRAPVRKAFAAAAKGLLKLVDRKVNPRFTPAGAVSDEALVLTAQMLGAVVLARLVDDPRLRQRILKSVSRP